MRYYAVAHFSKFIPAGSIKMTTNKNINDLIKAEETGEDGTVKTTVEKYGVNCVSYITLQGKIVTVVVNEGASRNIRFNVDAKNMTVYTTTQEKQLEETYKGKIEEIPLPSKCIMTVVFE